MIFLFHHQDISINLTKEMNEMLFFVSDLFFISNENIHKISNNPKLLNEGKNKNLYLHIKKSDLIY